MDFSVMFWGNYRPGEDPGGAYRLLLDVAKYADENGYAALWLPERHFHPWGGAFPNPSVLCAAVATITKRIRLRAGSVVVPLHNPIRIAEEWAVVDNLSGGRVEVSIASGWREDDFIFAPEAYADRKDLMFDSLEAVRKLWRGETIAAKNPSGTTIETKIYPRPIQADIPVWLTSAGSIRTMTDAGRGGFSLLTHLLGQSFEDLEKKIAQFRAYRAKAGLKGPERIALMLHTFLHDKADAVRDIVRAPLTSYLLESADVSISGPLRSQWAAVDDATKAEMMEVAFQRYFETASLIGTPAVCRKVVERAASLGVTDICCLVDFGLPTDVVMSGMPLLTQLKDSFAGK